MENENAYRNFDDLVFENRNKQYGAYAIRKSYNDNVNTATMIALLSSGLIVVFTIFITKGNEHGPIVDPIREKLTKLDIVPVIEQIKPPTKVTTVSPPRGDAVPVVTTAAVPDEPIKPNNENTGTNSDEPGDPNAIPAVGVATDSGPQVVAVAPPETKPTVLDFAAVMPQFVGGHSKMVEFIQRKFHYPSLARRTSTEGTVYISFVVDAEGNVTNVKVEKGISKECDEEAKRIIEAMPKWLAGQQGGIPVAVRQHLPIKFKLNFD